MAHNKRTNTAVADPITLSLEEVTSLVWRYPLKDLCRYFAPNADSSSFSDQGLKKNLERAGVAIPSIRDRQKLTQGHFVIYPDLRPEVAGRNITLFGVRNAGLDKVLQSSEYTETLRKFRQGQATQTVDREQLYKLAWLKRRRTLADALHMPTRELDEVLTDLQIPLPPQSHFEASKKGSGIVRPPLQPISNPKEFIIDAKIDLQALFASLPEIAAPKEISIDQTHLGPDAKALFQDWLREFQQGKKLASPSALIQGLQVLGLDQVDRAQILEALTNLPPQATLRRRLLALGVGEDDVPRVNSSLWALRHRFVTSEAAPSDIEAPEAGVSSDINLVVDSFLLSMWKMMRQSPGDWQLARDLSMFEVMASTGLTVAEVASIEIPGIDLFRRKLSFRKKGGNTVSVELPSTTLHSLSLYGSLMPFSRVKTLFVNSRKEPLTPPFVRIAFVKRMSAAGFRTDFQLGILWKRAVAPPGRRYGDDSTSDRM